MHTQTERITNFNDVLVIEPKKNPFQLYVQYMLLCAWLELWHIQQKGFIFTHQLQWETELSTDKKKIYK